jgi:hypothetical protein
MFTDIDDLWVGGRSGLIQKYISLIASVERPGVHEYLAWLYEETDFYRAPASANGHGNYEGGLLEHSIEVFYNLISLTGRAPIILPQDSIKIIGLCHDVCKANFYKQSYKQQKQVGPDGEELIGLNGKAVWHTVPYFTIDDKEPLGHGEKSVIIMQRFIKLAPEELMAIRWHMGGFDDTAQTYAGSLALRKAFETYPIAALTHFADHFASLPTEKAIV